MISSGQPPEQRVVFLERELERLVDAATVTILEASSKLLDSWGLADSTADIESIRHRFRVHGHNFTFRESRNRLRRLGVNDNSLSSPIVAFGMLMISDDQEVAESMRKLFEPRMNSLIVHPDVVASEEQYAAIIQRKDILPSERERQILNLGQDVFRGMGMDWISILAFMPSEFRDLARVRSALLDLSMLDLMEAAIANGFVTELRAVLLASIDDSVAVYSQVVSACLGERISELRIGLSPDHSSPTTNNAHPVHSPSVQSLSDPPFMVEAESPSSESALLSVKQVEALLGVSRITLRRMEKNGVLIPVRIGRTVRYDPVTIDQFLARRRK